MSETREVEPLKWHLQPGSEASDTEVKARPQAEESRDDDWLDQERSSAHFQ